MSIDSIIIDHERKVSSYLRNCLVNKFPEINIHGEVSSYEAAVKLIKVVNPALIFFDMHTLHSDRLPVLQEPARSHVATIYISNRAEDAVSAIRHSASGFLLKPLNVMDITQAVESAIRKLSENSLVAKRDPLISKDTSVSHANLVGIPTMEGIEFIYATDIIRCEGLQKCTRIITIRKNNMISSYSIGEFRKLLDANGFFSCHKSHLINLVHVRKLTREGFIYLIDNIPVPLARRKRLEFLGNLKHL
jgi:two-component system LytT family response regulator